MSTVIQARWARRARDRRHRGARRGHGPGARRGRRRRGGARSARAAPGNGGGHRGTGQARRHRVRRHERPGGARGTSSGTPKPPLARSTSSSTMPARSGVLLRPHMLTRTGTSWRRCVNLTRTVHPGSRARPSRCSSGKQGARSSLRGIAVELPGWHHRAWLHGVEERHPAGLTKALANEWAASNVNVNAIAPGYMATDNTAALQATIQVGRGPILKRVPGGALGASPQDIAGAAVFLACTSR